MIFQPEIETMSRSDMEKLQLKRLQDTVEYVYARSPMYKQKFDEMGIKPGDIHSLQDISKLPFTVKDDFRANYPYGMFTVPMKDIVRIHASSGTTGQPTVVGYTQRDIEMWADCVARLCAAGGVSNEDIAQISFGYGLFTGALGLHFGLARLGAAVIPISSGNTERQINLMHDFKVTTLIATPSYALYMSEVAEKMGMLDKVQLKYGLFGAEGSTEEMRAELEKRWGITATENYGMSELIGPGVSGECTFKTGMHINEDYFYCEIVNPDTGEPVPDGEWGELVVTPLYKEALPVIRYRTHDITRLLPGDCPCGRTLRRMQKIAGRSDDMLIIRGVNVFPSQIETVLLEQEGIGPHYEIVVTKKGYMDQIEVKVELIDATLLNSYQELEKLTKQIHDKLKVILQIDAKVTLVSPNTLKRFEGKAKRVTDLR